MDSEVGRIARYPGDHPVSLSDLWWLLVPSMEASLGARGPCCCRLHSGPTSRGRGQGRAERDLGAAQISALPGRPGPAPRDAHRSRASGEHHGAPRSGPAPNACTRPLTPGGGSLHCRATREVQWRRLAGPSSSSRGSRDIAETRNAAPVVLPRALLERATDSENHRGHRQGGICSGHPSITGSKEGARLGLSRARDNLRPPPTRPLRAVRSRQGEAIPNEGRDTLHAASSVGSFDPLRGEARGDSGGDPVPGWSQRPAHYLSVFPAILSGCLSGYWGGFWGAGPWQQRETQEKCLIQGSSARTRTSRRARKQHKKRRVKRHSRAPTSSQDPDNGEVLPEIRVNWQTIDWLVRGKFWKHVLEVSR